MDDMLIQSRTFDLLDWLLPKTEKFPRLYRHNITQRMMMVALDFQESLILAQNSRGRTRLKHLQHCDSRLIQLRLYLRLAHRWKWLSHGQYQHVSDIIAEIGRLLGGWLKQADTRKRKDTPALR